ncbi:IucA/IucC family siderophore biosynthesis protein [Cohnella sp. WQ 127256]|uniref:IucA/IucC family protein n=1 Tax=Cohnella sp. WQ 127256 TaxID=2938790 RepID=UPI0021193717|nr:IucA/IucC family protein [Cohnella sp. WQ 127256]
MLGTGKKQWLNRQEQANYHTCKTLLNCYVREFCYEHSSLFSINHQENTYEFDFPASDVILSGELSYYSAIGEHEYEHYRVNNGQELDYADLVQWIVRELQQHHSFITNEKAIDFSNKVANSYRNLNIFVEHSIHSTHARMLDYLSSEQSLLYGHPLHPFPKNTLGFAEDDVRKFCPELQASFQLCYMAVRKDVYREEWVTGKSRIALHESVQLYVQRMLQEKSGDYGVLPLHPWQYEHVQAIKAVKDYIEEEKIILLGSCGPLAYPTSSVRTVYIPAMRCNIKLPLNIQITNMRRNNNKEQMRRTLDAANYLVKRSCFDKELSTQIAYEVGVCECHFEEDDITKLLAVAYRPIEFDETSTFVLSSLVEAPMKDETPRLFALMDRRHIERWFQQYLDISLLPIVRIAEEKGIHFEAHLQNCLLTLKNGMPQAFIIRDLEGVSVNREKAVEDADTTGLLFYSKEEAWARTTYYFIVNHLGSLIHAIAKGVQVGEEYFWGMVREALKQEYEESGNEYVLHLLTANVFYAKKNMMSCLAGNSETPSYVPVNNRMNNVGSETNGTNRLLG